MREQINADRSAGATIGIPPVQAGDEAFAPVSPPRDEERNLQLPEGVYQMESAFPRNISRSRS
jgi:hypothetical protein